MSLGLGIAGQRGAAWAQQSIGALQPASWCNWLDGDAAPGYLPMAYYLTQPDRYIAAAQAKPRLYLCGNEPELADGRATPEQAKVFAERWSNEVGGEWAGFGNITDYWGVRSMSLCGGCGTTTLCGPSSSVKRACGHTPTACLGP